MKSRELKTTPELIVANYTFEPQQSGGTLHRFTPQNTGRIYQFYGPEKPVLEEGKAYNIGYCTENGEHWVDIDSIAKADEVDPLDSHRYAREYGEQIRAVESRKSDERITYDSADGYYLGKKYAWRIYGMALPRDVFDEYLAEIEHPSVPCVIQTQDSIASHSVAYRKEGLETAIDDLINSCERLHGNRFRSPLLPSMGYFTIKGIAAITDKK